MNLAQKRATISLGVFLAAVLVIVILVYAVPISQKRSRDRSMKAAEEVSTETKRAFEQFGR